MLYETVYFLSVIFSLLSSV